MAVVEQGGGKGPSNGMVYRMEPLHASPSPSHSLWTFLSDGKGLILTDPSRVEIVRSPSVNDGSIAEKAGVMQEVSYVAGKADTPGMLRPGRASSSVARSLLTIPRSAPRTEWSPCLHDFACLGCRHWSFRTFFLWKAVTKG